MHPRLLSIALLAVLLGAAAAPKPTTPTTPAPIKDRNYELVFQDEFDGNQGETAVKEHWADWAPGKRRDAFNVPEAARLDGEGHLVITTRHANERIETGGVSSKGKVELAGGYFECRCQLQKKAGLWSAFWVQSDTIGRPVDQPEQAGVEMDVMEYLATQQPDVVLHTLHWNGYAKEHHKVAHAKKKVAGLGEGWHIFGMKWDAEGYVFYTDGVETGRLKGPVSLRPQHLILSCEVGDWAGKIVPAELPDTFAVDWVRVWQTPEQKKATAEWKAKEKVEKEKGKREQR